MEVESGLMAKQISELTAVSTPTAAGDLFWIEQSGLPRKITRDEMITEIGGSIAGTTTDSTLRYDGANYIENLSVTATSGGVIKATGNTDAVLTGLIDNESTGTAALARYAITADTVSVALYSAGTGFTGTVVTGGPTGAQGVLRVLSDAPLILAQNNTERIRIEAAQTTFNHPIKGTAVASGLVNTINLESASPSVWWNETDQAPDEKGYKMFGTASNFSFFTTTDAGVATTQIFKVFRGTGTALLSFDLGTSLNVTGIVEIEDATAGQMIKLTDTGGAAAAAVAWIGFYDSAPTRQGFIGVGSGSDQDMTIQADIGDVNLIAGSGVIRLQDNTNVTGYMDATGVVSSSAAEPSPTPADGVSRMSGEHLYIDGKEAIDGNDLFLRLNPDPGNDFTSGVYTGGTIRFDGAWQSGASTATGFHQDSGSTLLQFNGGGILYWENNAEAHGKITMDTSAPSGGLAGDVHFRI